MSVQSNNENSNPKLNSSEGLGRNHEINFHRQRNKIHCISVSENSKRVILGLIIVVLLAASWVGAQQFSQSAVHVEGFDAPYFVIWFNTCWMILCFPAYCVFVVVKSVFGFEKNIKHELRDSTFIFEQSRVSIKEFFTRIFPMNILWVAVNYLYLFGLKYIAATDASAIMAGNVAFVYILSILLLKENFYIIRLFASSLCIVGIVLISYADGFSGGTVTGVLLAVFSAIGAAVYKVTFKLLVGSASLGKVSLFLALLGVSNALFLWTIFLALYFTGVDSMDVANIPWSFIITSSALNLTFNFLVNFGIAYTYPLFISIAMLLGVPLNAGVDVIIKGVVFSTWKLIGCLIILIGFVMTLFPDSWNIPLHRLFCCKSFIVSPEEVEDSSEENQGEQSINDTMAANANHF